jgi:hypothetical protein
MQLPLSTIWSLPAFLQLVLVLSQPLQSFLCYLQHLASTVQGLKHPGLSPNNLYKHSHGYYKLLWPLQVFYCLYNHLYMQNKYFLLVKLYPTLHIFLFAFFLHVESKFDRGLEPDTD